ncbi:MAG: CHAD domain-containing protein [Pseudomonadota bacterium]|nr:CHAD domain-containing protein [Pseudomonadota bacterium]
MTETLRKDETAADLPRLVRREIARARRHLGAMDDEPPLATHEARKAIKRARSIARLLRPADREAARRMNAAARRAGHVLAEARDADNLEELARALARNCDDAEMRRAFAEVARRARADSDRIDRRMAALQASQALDRMDEALAGATPVEDPGAIVSVGLARTYRRTVTRLEAARRHPDGEHLHDLRKRVQDWLYQGSALKRVWPEGVRRQKSRTEALIEGLGLHHDLTRLAARLDNLVGADAALALVEARREELARETLKQADKIYDRKPKRVKKALEAGV